MEKPTVYKYKFSKKDKRQFIICFIIGSFVFIFGAPLEEALLTGRPYAKLLYLMISNPYFYLVWIFLFFYALFLTVQAFTITVRSVGLVRFTLLKWEEMEAVEWDGKHSMLKVYHPNFPKFFFRKQYSYPFPVQNHAGFKADIIKYAPEGNPLREWVESEQFNAVHQD